MFAAQRHNPDAVRDGKIIDSQASVTPAWKRPWLQSLSSDTSAPKPATVSEHCPRRHQTGGCQNYHAGIGAGLKGETYSQTPLPQSLALFGKHINTPANHLTSARSVARRQPIRRGNAIGIDKKRPIWGAIVSTTQDCVQVLPPPGFASAPQSIVPMEEAIRCPKHR
jgi:hypothetical protein